LLGLAAVALAKHDYVSESNFMCQLCQSVVELNRE